MGYLRTGVKCRLAVVVTCAAVAIGTIGFIGSTESSNQVKTEKDGSSSEVTTTAVTQQTTVQTYAVSTYKQSAYKQSAQVKWGTKIEPAIKAVATTTAATTTKAATTTTKAATTTTKAATTTTKAATTTKATTAKPVTTTKIQGNPVIYDVGGSVKERLNSVKPEELKPTITVTGNERAVLTYLLRLSYHTYLLRLRRLEQSYPVCACKRLWHLHGVFSHNVRNASLYGLYSQHSMGTDSNGSRRLRSAYVGRGHHQRQCLCC